MMLAIKFILGRIGAGALDILQLALKHWRIVLPVIIYCLLLWENVGLRRDLHKAQQEHYLYMAEVSIDAAARQATLVEQERQVETFMDDSRKVYKAALNEMKDYYNAQIKADSANHARTTADLRSQLRDSLQAQADASIRSASLAGYPEWPAGSGGDSDPADTGERCEALQVQYETLELGCAITTQDYNTLASRYRRLCQIYPCRGLINE